MDVHAAYGDMISRVLGVSSFSARQSICGQLESLVCPVQFLPKEQSACACHKPSGPKKKLKYMDALGGLEWSCSIGKDLEYHQQGHYLPEREISFIMKLECPMGHSEVRPVPLAKPQFRGWLKTGGR